MSEEEALLAAIYANHDEDTPRLVFADWLDEHGQHEWAELIRLPLELARLEYYSWPWVRVRDRGTEIESKFRDQWLPHLDAEGKKRVRLWFDRGILEVVRVEHGTPEDFNNLGSLPGVRELCITDSTLTEEVVRNIAKFEQLDELSIWRTTFQTEWLDLLDSLPPWTAVAIDSPEADFAPAWEAFQHQRVARVPLAPVSRLRQMFRRRLGAERMYREYLPPGPILRGTLGNPNEFDLAALSRIPELEHLQLGGGTASTEGLRRLTRLPNLRAVEFSDPPVNPITALAACTQIERFRWTCPWHPERGVLTDEGTAGLERLTSLQELVLNGGPGELHDGVFQRLTPLKQLRSLELHFGALKEDSFSVLAGLPKLEVLKLAGPTRDDDVRHLGALPNLTCLVLAESCVTAAALGHLTRLTKLRTLFVRGDPAQVTEPAAQQLAAQLPDVTILLPDSVVRTHRTAWVFQRLLVSDCASLLCPTAWGPPDYRQDFDGVWATEDGWDHITHPLDDDRSAEIVCYAFGHASTKSAAEDVEEYTKNDHITNPQILERSVAELPGPESASCVWRANETQQVLCKVNLPDDSITLIGRVTPTRFEEFRRLFLFVARSLRVGDAATQGVGEEITVSVSEM